jgi:hypothetical protein
MHYIFAKGYQGPRTVEWSRSLAIGAEFLDVHIPEMWGQFAEAASAFGATAPEKLGPTGACTPDDVLAVIGAANQAAIEECGDSPPGPALIDFHSTGVDTWEVSFGSGRTSVTLARLVDDRNGDHRLTLTVRGPLDVADVPGVVDSVCTRADAAGAGVDELKELRDAVDRYLAESESA